MDTRKPTSGAAQDELVQVIQSYLAGMISLSEFKAAIGKHADDEELDVCNLVAFNVTYPQKSKAARQATGHF